MNVRGHFKIGTKDYPVKHDWSKEDRLAYRRYLSRTSNKLRRAKAKESGMCVCCCVNKPSAGRSVCDRCNERVKAHQRNKKLRESLL